MTALTIHEAATTTGWSPRMLRYVEQLGLVEAPRSGAGYRLYGPAELQRLRTLRELLEEHSLELGDVGVALRLRREPGLARALDAWFEAEPARPAVDDLAAAEEPVRSGVAEAAGVRATPLPADPAQEPAMSDEDWLAFEQAKHQQLLRR